MATSSSSAEQRECPELPLVMTLDEAAEVLRLGRDATRSLVDSGELKTLRFGPRSIRVAREDLLDLIRRSRTNGHTAHSDGSEPG